MSTGRIATESPSLFQVSGVGYNGFGYVTIEGDILSPNSNLSITNIIEVSNYCIFSFYISSSTVMSWQYTGSNSIICM